MKPAVEQKTYYCQCAMLKNIRNGRCTTCRGLDPALKPEEPPVKTVQITIKRDPRKRGGVGRANLRSV